MSTYLATYDLRETNPSPHSEFLSQAKELGWQLWILSSKNEWYRLPNTTLVGTFDNMEAAVDALKKTRAATESALGRTVTMEKWIITERGASRFDSDEHQPKK
jgi:hypothetical protein